MDLMVYDKDSKVVQADTDGNYKILFPNPTAVGQTQTVIYVVRNDHPKDRFEIIEAVSVEPDVKVELVGEKYLFPRDEIQMKITFSPQEARQTPLQDAQIKIKAWRIIEPEVK